MDWVGFADYRQRLGRYRIYTNLPAEQYPAHEVLALYHGRHVVERAYRQLKSNLMIAPMHLHKDNRLFALTWVYVVALMVLSLLQLLARRAALTPSASTRIPWRWSAPYRGAWASTPRVPTLSWKRRWISGGCRASRGIPSSAGRSLSPGTVVGSTSGWTRREARAGSR